ncbi:hypothetical protein AB7W75_01420 [Providencia huaxiensis]|uniref:rolling circle replication-associated protein n=1 Tax=Providencia TaxID=586 RepID=UPI0032DACF3C
MMDNFNTSHFNKNELDKGYAELLKGKDFKWFITLTYKNAANQKLTPNKVQKDIDTLHRFMHRKCFGKHYKNKDNADKMIINMFSSIEKGMDENIHIHILLSDILSGIETKTSTPLNELLLNTWREKILGEYANTDCQVITYINGVVHYILKESGTGYENIDLSKLS